MKKLIYMSLVLSAMAIACDNQDDLVSPEQSLVQELENYLSSQNHAFSRDNDGVNFEIHSSHKGEKVIEGISFELNDGSLIPEIQNILRNAGINSDISTQVFGNPESARTEECRTVWHFYHLSNGNTDLITCSNCHTSDGSYDCMYTHLH